MSRSAAARADHDRAVRAPAVPRRMSGPAHPSAPGRPPRARVDSRALAVSDTALVPSPLPRTRPRTPARPPLRLAAGGASLVLRVAEATMEVSGSRTMDRLVRSRAWVVIVGFGLIGIVAMQVSMLKLNNGIGRAVETAATLERSNAALRGQVSRLSSGDRIQALAGSRGFVMPEPADVSYLRAGTISSDGVRAARRMQGPNAEITGPAGSAVIAPTIAPTLTGTPAADAATATATGTGTPPATDPAAAPAGTTAATAPPPTGGATPVAPAPAAATGAATATPVAPAATAPTPSGGVTVP